MITKDMKIVVRYIMIVFMSYLAYTTVSQEYLLAVKDIHQNIVVGVHLAVFGALAGILKWNFETSVD